MNISKYRTGIVGCGNIGSEFDKVSGRKPIYTHAGAYFYHRKFKLVAAADISKEKLNRFATKWNVKNVYEDFTEMLDHESLDIVSVCTWKESHYEIVKKAIEKGVKMIFCEKPFTGELNKAKRLLDLSNKKNILLAVNYTRRYTECHQKVKELISQGKLGEMQTIICFYTKGFINNGSHVINLLTFFFGEVEWVSSLSSVGRFDEKEDYDLDIILHFPEELSVYIFSCDAKYYSLFEIDILGSLGRLKIIDSGYDIKWYQINNSPVFEGYSELEKKGTIIKSDMENAMINAIDNIIESFENKTDLICSGQDGLETIKIVDLAIKSAKDNGKKKYYNKRN